MIAPVPRDERDAAAADIGNRDRRARRSERCVERDLFDVVAEGVETRPAEDPDRSGWIPAHVRGGYALLASDPLDEPEEPDDPDDPLPFDEFLELDDDESDPDVPFPLPFDDPESEPEPEEPDSEEDDEDSFDRSFDAPLEDERLSVL